MKKMFLAMVLTALATSASAQQIVIPKGMTVDQVAFLFAIGQITAPLPYTVTFDSGCRIGETVFYTFTDGCEVADFTAGPWASNAIFPLPTQE